MKSFGVTCVIPFYNEEERILGVLKAVSKVKEFSQIICVDDGSEDSSKFKVQSSKFSNKKIYPQFRFIRFSKNRGKAEAIRKILRYIKSYFVFLIDGDLKNLNEKDISNAIDLIKNNPGLDMIILKRINAHWRTYWQRAHTIFSGERILKKTDLLVVFRNKPRGYQLEIAINKYMMDNKKEVRWIPSSAVNIFKNKKVGFIHGEIKDLLMHWTMIQYAGFLNYIHQILFFCRKKYHPLSFKD